MNLRSINSPRCSLDRLRVDNETPRVVALEQHTWMDLNRLIFVVVVAIGFLASYGHAAITEVGPIGLTVADLDREVAFFTKVLQFEKIAEAEERGEAIERLHALPGAKVRSATLRLGAETVTLTEFLAPKGRPIPQDSRSFDRWFQHIAIVVSDMDAAYAHLLKHKVAHVSTAPQTLPASNPNAGGIKAFYFRDPEDHVLEIIWFPLGKGDPRWQQESGNLFLGIDHTAIVVADTERSLAFYEDVLGFKVAGGAENFGVEQEHLNQTFGARLRITALRAAHGPGVEFLEYVTPPGGRVLPADSRTNDLLAWTTTVRAANAGTTIASAEAGGAVRASILGDRGLIRDPDGHLLLITP
jgi:catechol 2,3-dioxygenase-like lactoylglutathione lyase family enzyme